MLQKDTSASFSKDTFLFLTTMDLTGAIISHRLNGSPDSYAMPGYDPIPINFNGGDMITASDVKSSSTSSAEKSPASMEASAVKKTTTPARAQRVTPALMNAMALSYQTHFEAFCKGNINRLFISLDPNKPSTLEKKDGLIRSFRIKFGKKLKRTSRFNSSKGAICLIVAGSFERI